MRIKKRKQMKKVRPMNRIKPMNENVKLPNTISVGAFNFTTGVLNIPTSDTLLVESYNVTSERQTVTVTALNAETLEFLFVSPNPVQEIRMGRSAEYFINVTGVRNAIVIINTTSPRVISNVFGINGAIMTQSQLIPL